MARGIRLLRFHGLRYAHLIAPIFPLSALRREGIFFSYRGSVISYEYPKLSKKLVFSYIVRKAQTIYLRELNSSDGSEHITRK